MTVEEKFKDFFKSFPRYGIFLAKDWEDEIKNLSIEFAKYHVQKALKEASLKATAYNKAKFKGDINPEVDIDSILNAYSLDKIK